uniref:Uncharacterized protein n=1 Tax=Magallana gigas TaxID=29159 RepID=A0A8W8M2N0_MAGGI
MIPYQQLWQDVVQNLQKGAESQQFIAMTRSEVDHLDEKLHGEQKELAHGPASVPSSAQVLVKYYNRGDLLPLACPKCVRNALHSVGN